MESVESASQCYFKVESKKQSAATTIKKSTEDQEETNNSDIVDDKMEVRNARRQADVLKNIKKCRVGLESYAQLLSNTTNNVFTDLIQLAKIVQTFVIGLPQVIPEEANNSRDYHSLANWYHVEEEEQRQKKPAEPKVQVSITTSVDSVKDQGNVHNAVLIRKMDYYDEKAQKAKNVVGGQPYKITRQVREVLPQHKKEIELVYQLALVDSKQDKKKVKANAMDVDSSMVQFQKQESTELGDLILLCKVFELIDKKAAVIIDQYLSIMFGEKVVESPELAKHNRENHELANSIAEILYFEMYDTGHVQHFQKKVEMGEIELTEKQHDLIVKLKNVKRMVEKEDEIDAELERYKKKF